jgi:FkbM family methyltransferase
MSLLRTALLIKNYLLGRYATRSYSQEGEDLILARIFEGQGMGTYVDVGAHHPLRFSNTYLLYRRGWHGINIDATPGSMAAFKLLRPRDQNIELGIASKRGSATFYQFNEPAINTFDPKIATHNQSVGYHLVCKQTIKLSPLGTILHRYLPDKHIDLLSIDVEGLDKDVIDSMDWNYRPKTIVIEALGSNLESIKNMRIYKSISKHGYHLFAKTANSLIFLNG